MKFGKRLRTQIEDTLPDWQDKFLNYKDLKKRLKSISAPECFTRAAYHREPAVVVPTEAGMLSHLRTDLTLGTSGLA